MTSLRVVMIEDDFWVARVNQDLLEQDRHVRVIGVGANCAEGDQLVRDVKPDLVLLDVYLPDGTGLELLKSWRSRGELLDVIMVTAAGDLPSVREAVALGALDYIIKPFKGPRVQEALQRYRQRVQAAQEDFSQSRLDRFLGLPSKSALPKGIEAHMLERIMQLLHRHEGPMTSEQVGQQLSISRTTAWRYLEYLLEDGQVELDFSYGTQGRPTKLYRARE